MSFTLRQLRYFVGIAELGSFGTAAQRMAVSQPSLSQQMQVLQAQLGVNLFRSEGRGMALTDVGKAFLIDARQILAAAEAGAAHARALHGGLVGRVRVGCTDDFTSGPQLARLLAYFSKRPGLQLELHSGLSANLIAELVRDQLDLVLCAAGTPAPIGLTSCVIGEVNIVAVMPSAHRFARARHLRPVELSGEPLILLPPAVVSGFGQTCRQLLSEAGVVPPIVHSAANAQMAAAMASGGMGIALVARTSVILNSDLVAVPLLGNNAAVDLIAIRRTPPGPAGCDLLWTWMTTRHD